MVSVFTINGKVLVVIFMFKTGFRTVFLEEIVVWYIPGSFSCNTISVLKINSVVPLDKMLGNVWMGSMRLQNHELNITYQRWHVFQHLLDRFRVRTKFSSLSYYVLS